MADVDESDIYSEEDLERAEEDDELDELEEGFMKGYEAEDSGVCHRCKKVLAKEDVIEVEGYDGEIYHFCSERCAEKFNKTLPSY